MCMSHSWLLCHSWPSVRAGHLLMYPAEQYAEKICRHTLYSSVKTDQIYNINIRQCPNFTAMWCNVYCLNICVHASYARYKTIRKVPLHIMQCHHGAYYNKVLFLTTAGNMLHIIIVKQRFHRFRLSFYKSKNSSLIYLMVGCPV